MTFLFRFNICYYSVATGGQGGTECPLDNEKFAKNQEKEGENQEKREKEGKKRKHRKGLFFVVVVVFVFFTLPLLRDRAGYGTVC